VGVSENCALPGYYAASSGNHCVITQKIAILRYVVVEAWNHASWNVTTGTVYRRKCINCAQPVYHTTLLNILLSLRNKQMRFHVLKFESVCSCRQLLQVLQKLYKWQTATNRESSTVQICANNCIFQTAISERSTPQYTVCFTTLGHYCRRWFPRSLWSEKFI
jgi:hypothetical protein